MPGGAFETVAPAASARLGRDLAALMPLLRNFSRSLCGDWALADDMAQQALMKAWRAQASFKTGTNLKAWVFTILRNEFYSHKRRAWRDTHWDADAGERIPAPDNEQGWSLKLCDATRALGELRPCQRDALILVAAGGFSLKEAAKLSATPIGTVKSRVWRARLALSKILAEGTPLPPRGARRARAASDDVLAQLSALTSAGTTAAAHA